MLNLTEEKRKLIIKLPPPFTRFWPGSCRSTSPPSGALTVWRLRDQKWTSIHLPPSSGEMAAMQRWLLAAGGDTECWGNQRLLEHAANGCQQQKIFGCQMWRATPGLTIHAEENGASNQQTGLKQQIQAGEVAPKQKARWMGCQKPHRLPLPQM